MRGEISYFVVVAVFSACRKNVGLTINVGTITTTATVTMIQAHKRFKRTLIYYDIDNTMQIFRENPFFRPQNNT